MPDDDLNRENQSEAVKSCAESVMESNPDMDKSTAFAICQDMENKGQLTAPDDQREQGSAIRVHRNLQLNSDTVRRMERDDGGVTYQNIAILAAGEWTDGATQTTVYYAPEALELIAAEPEEHVLDNAVNVNHEHSDQLKQVGHFDPQSLTFKDDVLYADITLHRRTQSSKDTAELVDLALETKGEQGAGGPSVEIPFEGERSEFDRDRGMDKLTEFNLSGLSIVTHSASEDVAFEEQFADRAVAMSGDTPGVRVMSAGQIALTDDRHDPTMDPITDLDDLKELGEDAQLLTPDGSDEPSHVLADGETVSIDIEGASIDEIRDALAPKQELAGEGMEAVSMAVDEYLTSDGSPDDGVDAFLEWANANLDIDQDALEAAASDYLSASDAESLSDTPVSEFMAYLDEQMAGGDEDENSGHEDEEMGGELSELREENRELRAIIDDQAETLEAVTERLETLEDKPDYHDTGETAEADEDTGPRDHIVGLSKDGDYISR